MTAIETPEDNTAQAEPPLIEDAIPERAGEELKPPPEPALKVDVQPPKRSWKPLIVSLSLVVCGCLAWLGYRRRTDILWAFDTILPYSVALASVTYSAWKLRYQDWKKFEWPGAEGRHPFAAPIGMIILLIGGLFVGIHTYRERGKRETEKLENARQIKGLKTSVEDLSTEFHQFKDTINPGALKRGMSVLETKIDKALNPPKATLEFSFSPIVNPPVEGSEKALVPIRDTTLPLNADGSVHVSMTLINNTEVEAKNTILAVEICRLCKFAKDPERFTRVKGEPDTMRNHVYGDMPAAGPFEELSMDIIPPQTDAFTIQVSHRCSTCVLQRIGSTGIIRIRRD